jgi:hypothetical protein
MKLKTSLILLIFIVKATYSQTNPILDTLFQSSYKVYEMLRAPSGMYKKELNLTTSSNNVNASVAATGMGLISLCIADSMHWIANADSLALLTLKSLAGKTAGFVPSRNGSGYYPRFMDPVTGANAEVSPYATLDNAMLVSGALFCKKYFKNDSINKYAALLWKSINWSKAVSNAYNGELYTTTDSAGNGNGLLTKPYTAYILVAWLAKSQECDDNKKGGPGRKLWTLFYSNPDSLPVKSTYKNKQVLTEIPDKFLPESNYITPYYLCNFYAASVKYRTYMNNARLADSLWWAATKLTKPYETGISSGAGYSSPYLMDAINDNMDSIVSPQALSGYSPIYAKADNNLISMYKNNKGVYSLPGYLDKKVLWRYSVLHPTWKATVINAVDFATFMFGLAALPPFCGKKFFTANNDFFSPTASFTASHTSFCTGSCIDFTDKSIGKNLTYKWYFQGAVDTVSDVQNPTHICYASPGNYTAKLTVNNGCSNDVLQRTVSVKVPSPAPVISCAHDTLFSTPSFSYQWYFNGSPVGGNQKNYIATQDGIYTVCVTDTSMCRMCSLSYKYVATGMKEFTQQQYINVYPNPASNFLQVEIPMAIANRVTLLLTDALGRIIKTELAEAGTRVQMDISMLSPGVYCLHTSAIGLYQTNRIIKK